MPKPPYKEMEIRDARDPDCIATFTRQAREDAVIKLEVTGGVSVVFEPHILQVVATTLADDTKGRN